jgi:hypothetical protein
MVRSKSLLFPSSKYVVDPGRRQMAANQRMYKAAYRQALSGPYKTALNTQMEKLRRYPRVSI